MSTGHDHTTDNADEAGPSTLPAVLTALETAARQVSVTVGQAVVGIGGGWGVGSGLVVADGLVLTNAHNLVRGEVTVVAPGGRTMAGEIRGIDPDGDLAVVATDTAGLAPVPFTDTAPRMGQVVFALANPGGRGLRVTFGMVSAVERSFRGPRGRRVDGALEHTAPMARGSSGGPVVDAQGQLLGINTNRLGDGFYLALPTDTALRSRIDGLGRGEVPHRVRLGVGLASARAARQLRRAVGLPERDGLLVRLVEEGSAADQAGLRTGDLLATANGHALTSADDLHTVLNGLAPQTELPLTVVRGVEELTLTVTFPSAEAPTS